MKTAPPARPSPLLRWGLGLVAVAVPLAMFPNIVATYTLPKLVVLAAAVLVAWAGAWLSQRDGSLRPCPTPMDRAFLAAAAALAASAAVSMDRPMSVLGAYNFYVLGLWPLALAAAVHYAAAWGLAEEPSRRAALKLSLAGGLAVGAYALLQIADIDPIPIAGGGAANRLLVGRAVSSLGSPVSLGAYLALLLPVAVHWVLDERRDRLFGWACLLGIVGGLLASIARGGWLSALVGTAAFLGWTGRLGRPAWSRARWAAAASAAAALAAALAYRNSLRPSPRLDELARWEVWRMAWRAFRDHPLLGMGPDTFRLGFLRYRTLAHVAAVHGFEHQVHAHDDILQALATTGLVGTAAYLFWLASLARVVRAGLRDPKRRARTAALGAGLLALFVDMKFNPVPLDAVAVAALFVGLLSATGPGTVPPSPRPVPRKPAVSFLLGSLTASCALSFFCSVRLLRADSMIPAAGRGARPEAALRFFKAAIASDPCEMSYHIELLNFISSRLATIPDPGARRLFLEDAVRSAEQAIACHPHLGDAHYALGVASFLQAQAGLPERLAVAEASLDKAMEYDPLFVPLLELRLRAAAIRGDAPLAARLKDRIDRANAAARAGA